MKAYTFACNSGVEVLVSASSAEEAEEAWDEAVASGSAEPRASAARRATPAEVRYCVSRGHDYRVSS